MRRIFTQWLTELTDTRLCVYATLLVVATVYVTGVLSLASPMYWEIGVPIAMYFGTCLAVFLVAVTVMLFLGMRLLLSWWPAPPARRAWLLAAPAFLIVLLLLGNAAWSMIPWVQVRACMGGAVTHLHHTRYAHLAAPLTNRAYCQWDGELAPANLEAFCRAHELVPTDGLGLRTRLERDQFTPAWAQPAHFPASAVYYYREKNSPGYDNYWMLIWDAAHGRGWYIEIYQS